MTPLISVCIPSYNRAGVLPDLLDSIFAQESPDTEVVIAEDRSPERAAIAAVADAYAERFPGRLHYHENEVNLGFDGNLRRLAEIAQGEYVLYMGNDDLMCPGSLSVVSGALRRHSNLGVLLRSYASFEGTPDHILQEFRYFDGERLFPAGPDSIGTIYRRSVVISGMVVHREAANAVATEKFDGTLLYQLYLVARILARRDCVYVPQLISYYRTQGVPDFGNAESEKGKFVPREQTPESSVHFMKGMLEIAHYVERVEGVPIYDRILRDIANYSYPALAIQSKRPAVVFFRYYRELCRIGMARTPMIHLYFASLLLLGPRSVGRLVQWSKKLLGRTPIIGGVYRGNAIAGSKRT